jgi:hypothetical protein
MSNFEEKFQAKYGKTGEAFVQKWVDALESGKIKRVKETLNNGKGMCCLGVACDIMSEDGLVTKKVYEDNSVHYNGEHCFPTDNVQNKIDSVLSLYTDCTSLASRNDEGRTFKKTAAVIRTAMKKQGIILK